MPTVVTNGFTHYPEKLKGFEFVHVLAPYFLELAQEKGIDTRNCHFAPQPVDVEAFRPRNGQQMRSFLGIAEDDFVVLAVGAINRYKRMNYAIREVGMLRTKHPNVKLLIAGEPESGTPVVVNLGRKVLGNDVIFRTAVHDMMPAVYAAADVFVLPTRREITGNVFTEAMASGVPAIGDDYPVTRWIIGDGGDVTDMTRPGDLANLVEVYMTDGSYRSRKSKQARERAVDTFSMDSVSPQYLRMFNAVREDSRSA